MKTIFYLVCLVAFLMITGTSCTKEEETPIPSIEFKTGEYEPGINFVSTDTTLIAGSEFNFGILAESGSSKNITNVKITRKLDGGTPVIVKDSTTSSHALDLSWSITASETPGFYEEFICEVSDANKMSNTVSFTIYTLAADPGIIFYPEVILASFNLGFDHFFSVSNGGTYDTIDCLNEEIQELIDMVYFDNITTGHTFMSPDVVFLNNIYPSMELWTNKNITKFSKTEITSGAFDAIETIEDLTNAFDNGVSEFTLEFVDNNEEGHVLAFIAANGIKGLLNIKNTQSSANFGESIITFDVKIEKDIP